MRIWRVNFWDYSEPSHRGTFNTARRAEDMFLKAADEVLARTTDVGITVELSKDGQPEIRAFGGNGDTASLTGEYVEGGRSPRALTDDMLCALEVVSHNLYARILEAGFRLVPEETEVADPRQPWGSWGFVKD